MTREEIKILIQIDPDAVCDRILKLQEKVQHLEERIRHIENKLAKDSHNSSKPPSSDGLRRRKNKTKSQRKKTGKNNGGQKGHRGSNLKMVEKPDHTIRHKVNGKCSCGRCLENQPTIDQEKRQVFDLPDLKIKVTEHHIDIKKCECGQIHAADFPVGVNRPAQYGNRIKSLITYLMAYQHLPYERTSELVFDLFGHQISQGSLYNFYQTCYDGLEETEEFIKEQVIQTAVVGFDETGANVNKDRHWLHSASTQDFTYYACHKRRGHIAMDDIGILGQFAGIAIHDFWSSYLKYECDHGLCNAHHLRELNYISEQYKQSWAQEMTKLLLEIKKTVDTTKLHQDGLAQYLIHDFENKYQKIIQTGYEENPPPAEKIEKPKRGRPKRSEPIRLLDRFNEHAKKVLAFMYDFKVPFDNNLSERDLRMMKLHQKISGCFRSKKGADMFCRIRSYISSVKKHDLNVLDALSSVFKGQPLFCNCAE